MDKLLRPQVLETDPNAADATKSWRHWKCTFFNFLDTCDTSSSPVTDGEKLKLLINFVSPNIYSYFSDSSSFSDAITALDKAFVKDRSTIFARHELATRKQSEVENLDQYLHALKNLASFCDFQSVTATEYQDEYTRDAFINGLRNSYIRQRLLESRNLDLKVAYETARSLERAEEQANAYSSYPKLGDSSTSVATLEATTVTKQATVCDSHMSNDTSASVAITTKQNQWKCFWCGGPKHPRRLCPAKTDICRKCHTPGHWAKVCRGGSRTNPIASKDPTSASSASLHLCSVTCGAPSCLKASLIPVELNGKAFDALIDSGSSHSFIKTTVAADLSLSIKQSDELISLASNSCKVKILGFVTTDISIQGKLYKEVQLGVMDDLCADILIGIDFMLNRGLKTIVLGNNKESACIREWTTKTSNAACIQNKNSSLFQFLKPNCKPIATRSRNYSAEDRKFIASEVDRLRNKGVIEESCSPWRAQVIVTKEGRHKRRMVIDYSRTINIYTELDSYPLPSIHTMVNDLTKYSFFSTLDLEDAYCQEGIPECDRPYTAFEANGRLYQFKKIPFGVTNGVAAFQRRVDRFIDENNLKGVYAYVDNWTVGGRTLEEHNINLNNLMTAAARYGYKFNEKNCVFAVKEISLLGYAISNERMQPDSDRLQPLREMPIPHNLPALRRVIGLFSYYSQWIRNFSDLIRPLVQSNSFPLSNDALSAFENLKSEIEAAVLHHVDENKPFVIETDASNYAIAATLNQCGRPVAFFSRTLNSCEQKQAAVEKEALAIVEAIRKWRHYLYHKHFTLITDQRSVSFMFDTSKRSKIKNDKIERWRLELSCFSYDIVYREGKLNIPSDALSRTACSSIFASNRTISSMSNASLEEFHDKLCHPGVKRLYHFIKSRNLPFSLNDVKQICKDCPVCCKIKPRFVQRPCTHLIKATQPWERLSVDFKGPIPSNTQNNYILTIVDEYSRFPFAFPCRQTDSRSVIQCLTTLFSIFGMPMFIHSDRGTGFVSQELRNWLHTQGVATSNSSPFHPTGNSQIERYNGTIWKHVQLALESHNLPSKAWESVLTEALHAIRSLLCVATNATPHERLFSHQRRGSSGSSLPSWLCSPGKVFLKHHVKSSKYEPSVTEVDLLQANPQYATVKLTDGRESTVSLQDLAPVGKPSTSTDEGDDDDSSQFLSNPDDLRRSSRSSKPPMRLNYGPNFEINEGRMS